MKRRTVFATLLGAVGLALPVRTETKSSACPVCKTAARELKITGTQVVALPPTFVPIGGGGFGTTSPIHRQQIQPVYDREPAVAHRNDAGEMDWFWEDCQRCGCVFKVTM